MSGEGERYGRSTLHKKSVSGTGCTESNTVIAMTAGNHTFTAMHDGYTAEAQEGGSKRQNKRCTIVFEVRAPEGHSFSPLSLTSRGTYSLDNSSAKGSAQLAWSMDPLEQSVIRTFESTDGMAEKFEVTASSNGRQVWSTCGGTRLLRITTDISASLGSGSGARGARVDLETTEVQFTDLKMAVKRC